MTPDSVEPFSVDVDRATIEDLRSRLEGARWPDQLPDAGWDYGTERDYLQEVCEYWRTDYDWDGFKDRLNRFDAHVTQIDGQRVHFYHVRSPEPDAQPLLLNHGWPGSVVEFLDVLGPLADPAAHGGDPDDAFHVVAPSLPGYGFSGATTERGWDVPRIADAFATLMSRLGYDSFLAQGGDWGGLITACLGANYPERLDAIHTNMLFVRPSTIEDAFERLDEAGQADVEATQAFQETEVGYQEIQSTKPQTLAYGVTDSPVGLAGWILEKFRTWSEDPARLARDRLLDNLSVYWLTGTINASMRLYYETDLKTAVPDRVQVPTGHARYPGEIYKIPRVWAESVYDVGHWAEMDAGGHFAAMEVPDRFVADLRTCFRALA
jgi:pimeloyl-ACP methyl ester carboxylesterase